MLREAISSGTLANPIKLSHFLSAAAAAVKVDQRLNVTTLADQLRGISPSNVVFTTVPVSNMNYLTPTGESAVLWDSQAAAKLFADLKADKSLTNKAHPQRPRKKPSGPERSQVSVDVYNGTLINGLSASTGAQLTQLGFTVHGAGLSWTSADIDQTLIEYPPVMPGAALRQVSGLARIRIVLGASGYQITGSSPGASGQGSSPPIVQKTAAQDACRKSSG
jgi:hypothetical protein